MIHERLKALINLNRALNNQVKDMLETECDEYNQETYHALENLIVHVPKANGETEVHKISWDAHLSNALSEAFKDTILEEAAEHGLGTVYIKQQDGTRKLADGFVFDPVDNKVIEVLDIGAQALEEFAEDAIQDTTAKLKYQIGEAVLCTYCEDEDFNKRWYFESKPQMNNLMRKMVMKQIQEHITYIWE